MMDDSASIGGSTEQHLGSRARLTKFIAAGDHVKGIACAERLLATAPDDCYLLSRYAQCLMWIQRYEEAYCTYRKIYDAPPHMQAQAADYWLDGLTETCGCLGLSDEMRLYGREALTRADQSLSGGAAFSLPKARPPVFRTSKPHQNIIAYSLFGASPRYCETVIINARLCHEFFAGWTCRVYLDYSVPQHVRKRLLQAGAELVCVNTIGAGNLPGVTWRFLVADDPQVSRFLLRDADSLLSEREQAAVEQWLASDYWFHHIRDYFTHTELLLAGLWGGCAGVVCGMRDMISAYAATHTGSPRFVDQHFLRECLWPTVRQSLLSHDELFEFHNARPFPPYVSTYWNGMSFHVGSNAAYQQIRMPCDLAEGSLQKVLLDDAMDGQRLYLAPVKGGQWNLDLPFFLVDKYCRKELTIMPVS